MAWTTIETKNATYVVGFEHHHRQSKFPTEQVDGIVFEGVQPHPTSRQYDRLYSRTLGQLGAQKKPAYHGDFHVPLFSLKKWIPIIAALRYVPSYAIHIVGLSALIPFLLIPGKEMRLRKHLLPLFEGISTVTGPAIPLNTSEVIALRNAIIADKCEKVVAPSLKKKLGRKPIVGIIYGAAHGAHLRRMLQNAITRRRVISRMRENTRNISTIAKTTEYHFDPANNHWSSRQLEPIQLPKTRKAHHIIRAHARLARTKIKRIFRRKRLR